MNAKPLLSAAVLLGLWLAAPSPALADKNRWIRTQGHRVGLELDVLSKSADWTEDDVTSEVSTFGLSFALVGQLRWRDRLYLDAELPLAYGSLSASYRSERLGVDESSGASSFLFGNPTLGAHYARTFYRRLAVFFGGAFSIPVIDDPDENARAALQATTPARAFFDLHRLIPEHFPLRIRGGVEAKVDERLFYRADTAVTLALPTAGGGAELLVEQGSELEMRGKGALGGGLRLQAALTLTRDDMAQLALEPFVSYEPAKSALHGRAGLLVALDAPLGFGLAEDKVTTLRLAVGHRF
ncbi:hypothetical protein SOCEGT47_000640 [Sorangium cellulosum]|uniref:Secreted protein n=1 Tax=Sorangium cellulosum TaxID=56 RepID=A0A4V0NCL7_SORCE|nr:hypothetical protein [Sorangium cellulosum]AUX19612.1 hypothetical protein SOCEGT47_000640 [Sorangium cellulosum]